MRKLIIAWALAMTALACGGDGSKNSDNSPVSPTTDNRITFAAQYTVGGVVVASEPEPCSSSAASSCPQARPAFTARRSDDYVYTLSPGYYRIMGELRPDAIFTNPLLGIVFRARFTGSEIKGGVSAEPVRISWFGNDVQTSAGRGSGETCGAILELSSGGRGYLEWVLYFRVVSGYVGICP
jgi:hypothetical protein